MSRFEANFKKHGSQDCPRVVGVHHCKGLDDLCNRWMSDEEAPGEGPDSCWIGRAFLIMKKEVTSHRVRVDNIWPCKAVIPLIVVTCQTSFPLQVILANWYSRVMVYLLL